MIIAMIYFFLSYVIFNQQLKITLRKSSGPTLKKSPPPPPPPPLYIQIVQAPPLFARCLHQMLQQSVKYYQKEILILRHKTDITLTYTCKMSCEIA